MLGAGQAMQHPLAAILDGYREPGGEVPTFPATLQEILAHLPIANRLDVIRGPLMQRGCMDRLTSRRGYVEGLLFFYNTFLRISDINVD